MSYGAAEICDFLRAVDRHLDAPARIVIIGGSAAAFHNATSTTYDVDTCDALTDDLRQATARATDETGLEIPIGHSVVAEFPLNFEDRLVRKLSELVKLEVWILDKHDLALSKTVRGSAHDDQQIVEIHQTAGLDYETLVLRFRDEMKYVVGDLARVRSQFLQLIDLLFGELKRVDAERILLRDRS